MSAWKLLIQLGLRRVTVTADGDNLDVIAPAGALTDELRAALSELKPAILATLRRKVEITTRIRAAMQQADEKHPSRFDWSKDTAEVKQAEGALDESLYNYIEGNITLEDVETSFKAYMRSLEVHYNSTENQTEQLSLI